MSQPQTDQVIDAIGAALADAELTVDELGERVVAATGAWAGDLVMPAFQELWPRWRQEIGAAASRGLLCFGPNRGRRTTYTHPGRWLPGFRPAESDASAAELGRRYLHSYGPATPAQFARWLSAPERWADAVFSSLSGAIDRVQLEGSQSWALAGDAEPVDRQAEGVLLLPYFDPFVVGSYPRELLFPGRAGERALAGGQAGNYPVLLIDGTVAGVWHQRRSGSRIDVTVEPLGELTPAQRRGLDTQVERIGFILEGTARLTIGPVTTGPHA